MTDNGNGYETTVAISAQPVREIIGRELYVKPYWPTRTQRSVDETQTDYAFWDKLRRGKLEGYQLAGLLTKPVLDIHASWVLGDGFTFVLAEEPEDPENEADPIVYTNDLLSRWARRIHGSIQDSYADALALGDQYWAVNPDGSLSIPSPETVEKTTEDLDYRATASIKITTRLVKALIEDEYRPDGRTIRVTMYSEDENGKKRTARTNAVEFRNLIGRLPIVHHANDRSSNEIFGRPVYEAMLHPLSRYDDVIEKMIDGVELMGNPIPTYEGMEDIGETIDTLKSIEDEEYSDVDGNDETRTTINFDRIPVNFVGKGGHFHFASPAGGFTEDSRNALKALFLLLMDYTRIPEAVWGNELGSSRASAGEQMKPFYQYITWRRRKFEGEGSDDMLGFDASGGLLELADVWLRTRALTDPRVVVGPVVVEWPAIEAENAEVLVAKVKLARENGLLTDATALKLLALVDNPRDETEQAEEQAKERQEDSFNQQLATAQAEADIAAKNAPDEIDEAGGQGSPAESEQGENNVE